MIQSFIIYNSILIFSFLFAFLSEHIKEKYLKLFFRFTTFLCLWIPSAIRVGIGTDYYGYVGLLQDMKNGIIDEHIESGFNFINKIIVFLNIDSQWLFVITSFFTLFFLFLSIKRYFCLSILFYNLLLLYLYSYNIVRQGLAVTIIMYAITNMMAGHKVKYIVLVLFAALFHKISLVFLPFIFIYKIQYKTIAWIIFGLLITTFLLLIKSDIIISLFSVIPVIGESYMRYFMSDFYGSEMEISTTGLIARLIPGILILLFAPQILNKYPHYGAVVMMVLVYICFVLFWTKYFLFYRLIQFFLLSLVFMLPPLISSIRKNNLLHSLVHYTVCFIIIFVCFISYERYISRESSKTFGSKNIIPYTSIFNSKQY
jgi:hypothetical protein